MTTCWTCDEPAVDGDVLCAVHNERHEAQAAAYAAEWQRALDGTTYREALASVAKVERFMKERRCLCHTTH